MDYRSEDVIFSLLTLHTINFFDIAGMEVCNSSFPKMHCGISRVQSFCLVFQGGPGAKYLVVNGLNRKQTHNCQWQLSCWISFSQAESL